jgi:flagellar hook-associated protein 1 FlgK
LLALPALRGTGGVEARWAALGRVPGAGLELSPLRGRRRSTRRDGSFAARDEVSGIDLDREATELLRYQRAYDGSAKIIQVSRDTLQAILDLF